MEHGHISYADKMRRMVAPHTGNLERVTFDPDVCHGKPTIRGMRWPVETLLELLASGMSEMEILSDHPELEPQDVSAALEFAATIVRDTFASESGHRSSDVRLGISTSGTHNNSRNSVQRAESSVAPQQDQSGDELDAFISIADSLNGIWEQGFAAYQPIALQIINGEITDRNEIELTLDYMLDFCGNSKMLTLYKQVCRSLVDEYPDIIYNAVMGYKEMYDDGDEDINEAL